MGSNWRGAQKKKEKKKPVDLESQLKKPRVGFSKPTRRLEKIHNQRAGTLGKGGARKTRKKKYYLTTKTPKKKRVDRDALGHCWMEAYEGHEKKRTDSVPRPLTKIPSKVPHGRGKRVPKPQTSYEHELKGSKKKGQ